MTTDTKLKVLLVDDEKFLLEMYAIKFLKSGFDVVTCPSGEEALETLRGGYQPDIILSDITMPEMSGYEFLHHTNEIKLPRHCVKIALTNESQDAEKMRTMELGVAAHLIKAEFTPAEIVAKVTEILKERGLV
jgi:CheY-like chemotaxis protein